MNYDDFVKSDNLFAVVGVSQDKSKWGRKIFDLLLAKNYNVVPLNPNYEYIGKHKCYKSLSDLNKCPDVVVTATPPSVTSQIVEECINLSIKKIWIQPGSESQSAIDRCLENQIECIHNACILLDGLNIRLN